MYFNNIVEQVPAAHLPGSSESNVSAPFVPQQESTWTNTRAGEHDEEQEDEEEDDEEGQKRQTPAGKKRKQELHRRHSKRYRDNLGELFNSLEQLLPRVVPGCKLKTKSQIIANSVGAIKLLRSEVSALEIEYVLSSPANRTRWVEDTVCNAFCFQDVVDPFMRLLLSMQKWKHSELWSRHEMTVLSDGTERKVPVSKPTESVHELRSSSQKRFFLKLQTTASANETPPNVLPLYKRFSDNSREQVFSAGDNSLVGRTASSLSPEVIDLRSPESSNGFVRAQEALECQFIICFAVPFLVRGHVFAAVLFYDDRPRANVNADLNIAQDLASSLSNCYGASKVHAKESGSHTSSK